MNRLLMPKGTAIWLVENTALTFDQIADFCGFHPLEVQAIADGDADIGVVGFDPISNNQLTREEIKRCEENPSLRLHLKQIEEQAFKVKETKKSRYTPMAKRHGRPDAILWLLRNHAELSDAQIVRLVGTTKSTIKAIRERTHWNSANLKPRHPVNLGLCSQRDLDLAVTAAQKQRAIVVEDEAVKAE